jgi:hypothetical protein
MVTGLLVTGLLSPGYCHRVIVTGLFVTGLFVTGLFHLSPGYFTGLLSPGYYRGYYRVIVTGLFAKWIESRLVTDRHDPSESLRNLTFLNGGIDGTRFCVECFPAASQKGHACL